MAFALVEDLGAGRRVHQHVGYRDEGISREDAARALAFELERVRRGEWSAPESKQAPPPAPVPGFHFFASEYLERREAEGKAPRTIEYLRWVLTHHLLPYFEHHGLVDITPEEVDRYVQAKLREGRLGAAAINRTLGVLASVLEDAVEYGHLTRNAAKGKRRRLPVKAPRRRHLEPQEVLALLVAAGELDAKVPAPRRRRQPLIATLAYSGLRIGELLALRWRDVDLAAGKVLVRESRTEAGVRSIDLQPELRETLVEWKMNTRYADAGELVFPTHKGRQENRQNVRRRVLIRCAEVANELLAAQHEGDVCELESMLVSERLSPHPLRRTFASWLVAEGEDAAYVMQQIGHTDPQMTLGLYAKALTSKRRRAHEIAPPRAEQPGAVDQRL